MRLKKAQRDEMTAKIKVCPTSPEYRQVNQAPRSPSRIASRAPSDDRNEAVTARLVRADMAWKLETTLRKLLISMAIIVASSAFAGASPAEAQEYRWCLQGRQTGYPGDCNYQTRAQCLASASGRNAGCGINPRAAYGRQRQAR